MTPDHIYATRKRLGLTQAELATLIGVSRDTVLRAERDGRMIPGMEATYRLIDRFGADAIEALRSPNLTATTAGA
jgi:DNA-binding XRE family transcriptional regulator